MTLDNQIPPEEQMTTDETREAVEYLQTVRQNFQASKTVKPPDTDDDGATE